MKTKSNNNSNQKFQKTGKRNRGSKPRSTRSPRAKVGDADEVIETRNKDNDVSWYGKNPELLKAAASLPFSQSLGSRMTLLASRTVKQWDGNAFPGLMALRYVPSPVANIGSNADQEATKDSAINIAANGIYTTIRSHNSGGKNYDATNLMMYLLAMDNAYAFYSWMTRVYGCMKVYSQRNRYLPEMLVTASGCDYDDLIGRMAEFRYYINMFAAKASSMCVPAILSYFQRHFWLSQNVFADDQTLKAQMYMFVPSCFFYYVPNSKPFPSVAATPALHPLFQINQGTRYKLEDIRTAGDTILRAIITDEDFNIMSGDILKAFGESQLFRLSPIPEEHIVLPVYSEEVLTQIENATVFGVPAPRYGATEAPATNTSASNRIWEAIDKATATGFIICGTTPFYVGTSATEWYTPSPATGSVRDIARISPYGVNQLLNLHKDDVSPEDVMIATRLKPAVYDNPNTAYPLVGAKLTGSEWLNSATIYKFVWDSNGVRGIQETEFCTAVSSIDDSVLDAIIFQRHPIITKVTKGSGATPLQIDRFIGDIDNYTYVDNMTLSRIHETALLSEFSVPLLGTF